MFSLAHFLVSAAYAQDAAAPAVVPSPTAAAGLMSYLPFILIFGIFYFLVIRPQQQKLNEQGKMIKALQRGDRVITNGGLHGKITRVEDDHVVIEIADGVQVKHEKSQIQGLAVKLQPVGVPAEDKK